MSVELTLPPHVQGCLNALEAAGFESFAVGGCVRDALLGRAPQDYDLCTAAPPQDIKRVFSEERLVLAGEKHGTVGVITPGGVVEITAFRAEGAYSDRRHPDRVDFVSEVERDLARRDFTVNAMAFSPLRGLRDPFGGARDLENRVLRAVGDPETRFREDALRILRGVRFAAALDLTPEEQTRRAMLELAPLLDCLARERVFEELSRCLPVLTWREMLDFAPIFAAAVPELGPTVGFDQRSPHHRYSLFEHIARVTASLAPEPALKWAGLLHDIGKPPAFTPDATGRGHFPGHAALGAEMAEAVLRRLRAPTALRERVCLLIREHMTPLPPDKRILRRRLGKFGPEATSQILALQRADYAGKGTPESADLGEFDRVVALLREIQEEEKCLTLKDLQVGGDDLLALGYPRNRKLGETLEKLLALVQDETVENRRDALLAEARRMLAEN